MPIADNVNYSPSRLLTSTATVRNQLVARNLYTPNRIYPITEKQQVQNVVNSVSSVLSIIAPFKSIDLKNTVFARLIVQQSPLSDIGLAMLGVQMAYNAGSHIAQQTFPTIKLANMFDGDKNTHLFTKNINFSITKKQGITNFQEFIDAVTFFNPSRKNPFKGGQSTNINTIPISSNPLIQNSFYIKNTGGGQITFLINAFNQNIYKEGFGRTPTDNALQAAASEIKATFTERSALIGSESSPQNKYQNYYNFFTSQGNPYSTLQPLDSASITNANGAMVFAMNHPNVINATQPTQEYAPNINYIQQNLGTTIKKQEYEISEISNDWINPQDEFNTNEMSQYSSQDKLIWGRDGIAPVADDKINNLRGFYNFADQVVAPIDNVNKNFNAYQGILEYTRNLLNASEGRVVDQTRKAFLKGKNVEGFNGSALWVANNSKYAIKNQTANQTGVRQHSSLDQYNRFAKAIRFNGNEVYQGNPNSVIFKSVIPRIHPTIDKNEATNKSVLNNKNLMLSLENLAVRVISNNDGVGIIDDEYGSTIPGCEVGQFNGRQMWFPPYDVTIQETTNAAWESTSMVGRSEPMYAYQNSTRAATLTFTLLVDYPYQLKNALYQGENKHKAIAEFFAFGGDPFELLTYVDNPSKKVADNEAKQLDITGPDQPIRPDVQAPSDTIIVFPNDFPNENEIRNAIDDMYTKSQYQIEDGFRDSTGKITEAGLNSEIFVKVGLVGNTTAPPTDAKRLHLDKSLIPNGFSQYTSTNMSPTIGSKLTEKLNDVFRNPTNREYYYVSIVGGASKLHTPEYNILLGERRAKAAKKLVDDRIKELFGSYPQDLSPKIKIITETTGSDLAGPSTADPNRKEELETIRSRHAIISIVPNGDTPSLKFIDMSENDKKDLSVLKDEMNAISKVRSSQKSKGGTDCVYNERGKDTAAILNGFKSISGNYLYPVFHSQTPEDFHRRLTFLQQCMRQGAAKRYDMTDENGILRAKNSVFGRQPICILRIGDFFFTKVVINQLNIDYTDAPWDMNPEGFGMQPMLAKITLQMNIIGGQSLVGPIDALQNALTFNYYANSNFANTGMYSLPSQEADKQLSYMNGILTSEENRLTDRLRYNLVASYMGLPRK
jgi:hypothetical protein